MAQVPDRRRRLARPSLPLWRSKIHGSGAEKEKPPIRLPLPPPPAINHSAQGLKNLWYALKLIQNHQLIRMIREIIYRAYKFLPILGVLQIQINRRLPGGDFLRQRGLAHLTRSQQNNGGSAFQKVVYARTKAAI